MLLAIRRHSSAFRFVFVACACLLAIHSADARPASGQDIADEEKPPVVSSNSADSELSEAINGSQKQFTETGEFSDQAKETLRKSLEKQYDSYVSNFKDENTATADPALIKQAEFMAESRDTFVDMRFRMASRELMGVAVPGMEYQAFLDLCARLGMRVDLNGKLVQGAPIADTQIVVLMLPKMDCPGCAEVVRSKLGEIEGVFDSVTSVELGNCRVQLSTDTKLDDKLNELAKTVVQFQEWTMR